MDITVRIPDDLAKWLGSVGDLERRALEALPFEEFNHADRRKICAIDRRIAD